VASIGTATDSGIERQIAWSRPRAGSDRQSASRTPVVDHAASEVVHKVLVVWSPRTVWSGSGVEARAEGVSTTAQCVSFKLFDAVRKIESAISDECGMEKTAQLRTQLNHSPPTGLGHATWTASFSRAGTFSGNETMR
jgi:hypothetical protein